MSFRTLVIAGTVLALAATAAVAFDAGQSGPAPKPIEPSAKSPTTTGKSVELTDPSQALPKSNNGTKVTIPGLGVIGVIPKMDFGLELLYGANEPTQPGLELDEAAPGELTIQGRVKREF